MASVLIPGDKAQTPIHLNLNGKRLPIPFNVATPVPDDFLAVLAASDIAFEIVDGADLLAPEPASAPPASLSGLGEDGDGGSQQGADAVADEPVAPASEFLDRAVADIVPDLAGLSLSELEGVRIAEVGGKTRKTLLIEIEALIAAKTEG